MIFCCLKTCIDAAAVDLGGKVVGTSAPVVINARQVTASAGWSSREAVCCFHKSWHVNAKHSQRVDLCGYVPCAWSLFTYVDRRLYNFQFRDVTRSHPSGASVFMYTWPQELPACTWL